MCCHIGHRGPVEGRRQGFTLDRLTKEIADGTSPKKNDNNSNLAYVNSVLREECCGIVSG